MKAADYVIEIDRKRGEIDGAELIALNVILRYVYMQNSVEGIMEDAVILHYSRSKFIILSIQIRNSTFNCERQTHGNLSP